MNVQRANPYVSCIKIRGVPIIAPLMTDDLRTEMKYYKHLAMAVEERLKNLEAAAESASQSSAVAPDDGISTTEDSSTCEPESDSLDRTDKSAKAVVDLTTKETSIAENDNESSDNPDSSPVQTAREVISWKSLSPQESSCRNDGSDVVTASTDIDRYLNGSSECDHPASIAKDIGESQKPAVPKTLDIVPITVDAPLPVQTATSFEGSSSLDDKPKSQTSSPDSDETPKLVRQGSYVLETPSPMLLAHLHEEMVDYVPSNSATKRREWNLTEAKSEWELRKKEHHSTSITSRSSVANRTRRNSASGATSQKTNGYATPSRAGKYLSDSKRVARSVDCIQSMMSNENNAKNGKFIDKNNINNGNCKKNVNGIADKTNTRDNLILNLANKLGGSLGSLSNSGIRCGKRTPKKTSVNRLSKSFDSGENTTKSRSPVVRGSTQKLLSTVTSDKLVHVFEEIQMTHERQMKELIARQCQEQRMMQKEFDKQQNLLIAQIEQTFPGISLRRIVDKVAPPVQSPNEIHDNTSKIVHSHMKISTEATMTNGLHDRSKDENVKCPLDDLYPRDKIEESHCEKSNRPTCDKVIEQKSPPIGLYSTYVINGERLNSGVSRQLFPLEGKTRHVPVPNRSVYQEQHIKAATIITAYARGFLVRRLLQTDRVIDLKITYKEALHCMLKLHVDAPLALPELNFHQRLQLQCDAASMNIVELFAQDATKRMEIIRHDREIKRARQERPNSARSYSFATQRTLARKKLKEMGHFETPGGSRTTTLRSRCQTWASNAREKRSPYLLNQGIKRSTSAGAVRKPWR